MRRLDTHLRNNFASDVARGTRLHPRGGGLLHRRLRDFRAALLRAADPAGILAPVSSSRRPRSLAVSVATVVDGGALFSPASPPKFGRKPVMVASLVVSSLATLAVAAARLDALLALRGLTGLALSGLPSVAMAYLAEEIAPAARLRDGL